MNPALVIVDIQKRFFRTPERRVCLPRLVDSINELSQWFRQKDLPVVRVISVHKADRSTWCMWMKKTGTPLLIEGTEEAQELPELSASKSDLILEKTRFSAFAKTEFETFLSAHGINTIVLTGVMTNYCIGWTAVDAHQRDFQVLLARDGIFSHMTSQTEAVLEGLKDCADIEPISNEDIMQILEQNVALPEAETD